MNNQQHPHSPARLNNLKLIQFMPRARQIAQQETGADNGYAMMLTSIVSVLMFSLLAAYMTTTNLTKSATNAYVDGNSTFYVAESGLNKRAQELRQRFIEQLTPSAGATTMPASIADCFSVLTTATTTNNDFECRNYAFKSNNNNVESHNSDGGIVLNERDNNRNSSNYVAYTFVKPKQDYAVTAPTPARIPNGQVYGGLNALEYKYTVYSTAKKPNAANAPVTANFSTAEIDAKEREKNGTKTAADNTLIAAYDAKQAQAALFASWGKM